MRRYECRFEDWNYVYELWPAKLVVSSATLFEENQHHVEFIHCSASVDKGTSAYDQFHPKLDWFVITVIVLVSIVGLGLVVGFAQLIREDYAVVFFMVFLAALHFVPRLLKTSRLQHYAVLKSKSTGSPLATLVSALDPADDFREFVEELRTAIRNAHDPQEHGDEDRTRITVL